MASVTARINIFPNHILRALWNAAHQNHLVFRLLAERYRVNLVTVLRPIILETARVNTPVVTGRLSRGYVAHDTGTHVVVENHVPYAGFVRYREVSFLGARRVGPMLQNIMLYHMNLEAGALLEQVRRRGVT